MVQDLWNKFFGPKAKSVEYTIDSNQPEWCDICNRYIEWDGHTGELHYKALLKEAHDKMDDYNANRAIVGCRWCNPKFPGYDANGLIHTDDCILVKIRKVL